MARLRPGEQLRQVLCELQQPIGDIGVGLRPLVQLGELLLHELAAFAASSNVRGAG